jgi:hypothetical protein
MAARAVLVALVVLFAVLPLAGTSDALVACVDLTTKSPRAYLAEGDSCGGDTASIDAVGG